ncbi:MAG: hypothetical protein KA116_11970 [Proteobacteria bacterium]|nr:hypothetical protein [Pseudomonadota bacterium]
MSDGETPRASGVAQAALVIEFKDSDRFPGPFLRAQLILGCGYALTFRDNQRYALLVEVYENI